jgi:hypothetical protein
MFVINNPSYFQTNTSLHGIDTRQKSKLHKPLYKLSSIQKGIIYTAINVYNKPPFCIAQFQYNEVQFRNALKKYLLMHTFILLKNFYLNSYLNSNKVAYFGTNVITLHVLC